MILIRSTALGQIKEMERNNKIKINKCVLSLPGSGPSSVSDTPALSGPSHCGSGHRRRRVRDRRQLGGHQDDVTTGRRGGAHGGGDALRGRGAEEEDGGGVIWQEGQILLPRMPFSSLSSSSLVDFLPAVKHIFILLLLFLATFYFVQKKNWLETSVRDLGGKIWNLRLFFFLCGFFTFAVSARFPRLRLFLMSSFLLLKLRGVEQEKHAEFSEMKCFLSVSFNVTSLTTRRPTLTCVDPEGRCFTLFRKLTVNLGHLKSVCYVTMTSDLWLHGCETHFPRVPSFCSAATDWLWPSLSWWCFRSSFVLNTDDDVDVWSSCLFDA